MINFELPWNPAKKNQRIGRIDRVGQRSENLTVLNFITRDSIEVRIASGLMLKQNLFEGVLDTDSVTDMVDFSSRGRSQFMQQIETMVEDFQDPMVEEIEVEEGLLKELTDLSPEEAVSDEEVISTSATPEAPEEKSPQKGKQAKSTTQHQQMEEVEQVMNQGMSFLSGLFKMATGKEMGAEEAKVEVNQDTGEVTLKFKLPNL